MKPASCSWPRIWRAPRDPTGYLTRHRVLAISLAVMAMFSVTGEAANVVLVPWVATVHLHGSPAVLSATWICFSLGGLLATMTLGSMRNLRRRGPWPR